MTQKPDHPAAKKAGPQHQATETHGTITQPQRGGAKAAHTARGSEGDRRRAANMER